MPPFQVMETIPEHQHSSATDSTQRKDATVPVPVPSINDSSPSFLSSHLPNPQPEDQRLQINTPFRPQTQPSRKHRFVTAIKRHIPLRLIWPRAYSKLLARKHDTGDAGTSHAISRRHAIMRRQHVLAWIPKEIKHYPLTLIKGRLKQFGQNVCQHIRLGHASWAFLTGVCRWKSMYETKAQEREERERETMATTTQATAASTAVWHSKCICCNFSHACPAKGCGTEWRIVRRPSIRDEGDDEVVLDVVRRLNDMKEGEGSGEDEEEGNGEDGEERNCEDDGEDEEQRARRIVERLRERGITWEPTSLPFRSWGDDRVCRRRRKLDGLDRVERLRNK